MATKGECETALRGLARRLDAVDEPVRRRYVQERTVSCTVPDLDVCFTGRLHDGALTGIVDAAADDPRHGTAQIRLTMSSDDLVALTDGSLPLAAAWADGRVKVEASMLDLLKLRGLALTRQPNA